ncbi:pentatricopeptide repeat-containing protein At2g22410, mitochondrial [Dendrobium catenatum]|uniref:Pentatricopeptide repeat-containing protein n=1 Tax=Dendrobium catenatum TaxID=906689 RepID=A0A2I0WNZ0_9ASPA|nr:pentatricopeptide repeat-containing protein At2g22410, mitochondrial [Dendrobium catenatum]PKU77366.1 Pentatricopeptide repeat-containing protein [Dendrobium catenatum]
MEAIKLLHGQLIVSGLHRHPLHISKVLAFYTISPSHLPHSLLIFNQIENPNTFIFNTMFRAFAQSNTPTEALLLYSQSRALGLKHDNMTFPFVLKACVKIPAMIDGQWIHVHVLKLGFISDVFISNALISLYSSCKELGYARQLFDEMTVRDLVSWNSLICGSAKAQRFNDVLRLFEMMRAAKVKADGVTMVNVISACTQLREWELGETVVKYIEDNCIEVDLYLGNTLIDYYGRRGFVEDAQKLFDEMREKNSITMNAMIATFAKAGDLVGARKMFDRMPERDLVSWSLMITGYCQMKNFLEALELFRKMQKTKIKPDEIVIASVLSACAHLVARNLGRSVHACIRRNGITMDIFVGNTLIDMYSKCGCISEAYKVFDGMRKKDTLTWNSIILGLATSGNGDSALQAFSDMLRTEFKPDEVTFLGVLIACVHSGLVDEGLKYFESMREVHGVEPQMKHYGCVIDLLSRCGQLDKAFEFIGEMIMRPDAIAWRAFLGACKVHGNVTMAEYANKKLNKLDPGDSGNYVLLSHAYAAAERWNDVVKLREKVAEVDIRKNPGWSIIEIGNSSVSSKVAAS